MFNYAPMMSSSIPFSLPGASVATTAAKSSLSFSSIFNGIQKTATTINQIVPLYNNIKPILSNSKALFSIMKGVASSPNKTNNSEQKNEENKKMNDNIIDTSSTIKEDRTEITSTTTPSKPFFA